MFDQERALLVRALRAGNWLYTVKLTLVAPVCLLAKGDDKAWLWHGWYGHLNFRALRKLGVKEMVNGIPVIDRVEQVRDGCALRKQHRMPFPHATSYHAERRLELVHADLCGQISPPTPGGKNYFLLIMDDYSRYMWLELLTSKDQALHFIKLIMASAEG